MHIKVTPNKFWPKNFDPLSIPLFWASIQNCTKGIGQTRLKVLEIPETEVQLTLNEYKPKYSNIYCIYDYHDSAFFTPD